MLRAEPGCVAVTLDAEHVVQWMYSQQACTLDIVVRALHTRDIVACERVGGRAFVRVV
jgi:hypothetical protein